MSRIRCFVLIVVTAALIPTASAHAALSFSDPAPLPKSLPGKDQLPGGEPSLAFDPAGDGHLYAVAPGGDGEKGVGFWGSATNGASWQYVRAVGSQAGGGDSDVDVGLDHTVFVLDLEIASSAVCRSHDFGKTFEDGCETGAAQEQAGAEEDRQWLSHDPKDKNLLYFNYHDLTLQYPIMEKSVDGGSSFMPCGNLVDPGSPLFPSSIGNTIVGKSAVATDGNIYVPIGAPTPSQVSDSLSGGGIARYGQIVIAYDKGCNGNQFKNATVYSGDTASFSNLFISNVVGPDGALYVIASGQLNDKDNYNTYLWVSRDGAQKFTGPIKVNPGDQKTTVMSAVAAGTKPGHVALGWYGSQNAKDPNDTSGIWRYYAATSNDYGKTWQQATVTPNAFHYGDICTVGIACLQTGGNRNLLDFSSIAANPKTGCYTTVFPGDPFDTPDREAKGDTDAAAAYISNQACSGGGGTLGSRAGCHDRTAPVSAISRRRSRFTRSGIRLRGLATDKGCGPRGRGKVARETLAISRRVGKKCQWLQPKGGLGPKGSCRKKTYVTANGTSRWTFTRKMRLPRGIYAVVARGIDSVGNVERPARGTRKSRRNHNHYLFKVR